MVNLPKPNSILTYATVGRFLVFNDLDASNVILESF